MEKEAEIRKHNIIYTMPICPNKSSNEWKVLIENLKIYLIELDMYKDDADVEQWALVAYFRYKKAEVPNPVQAMRLIVEKMEDKKKRFEDYLTNSKRQNNLRWRMKALPPLKQDNIKRHWVIHSLMEKKGESKEFMDKLHYYLNVYDKVEQL